MLLERVALVGQNIFSAVYVSWTRYGCNKSKFDCAHLVAVASFSRYALPRTRVNNKPAIHMTSKIASPVKHHPYPIAVSTASMIAAAIAAPIFRSRLDRAIRAAVEVGIHSV
jgi:hypothetical protein